VNVNPSFSQDADVYLIGNSLTNDTLPHLIDNSRWHIFCNRNLEYIFNEPNGHCVGSSIAWPEALMDLEFRYVTVQPFGGTTLTEDRDIISTWMFLQPNAGFVVHSGWSTQATFPTVYQSGNIDDRMKASPEYMSDLVNSLREIHPERLIVETRANDLLYSVWLDILDSQLTDGPFDDYVLNSGGTVSPQDDLSDGTPSNDPFSETDSYGQGNPEYNGPMPFDLTNGNHVDPDPPSPFSETDANSGKHDPEIRLPFSDFSELYRDPIHMDLMTGRFLMHNAMRYATRQPLFDRSFFTTLEDQEYLYLKNKIIEVVVIPGDLNRDERVSLIDINEFIEVLQNGSYDICADINQDQIVGLDDIGPFVDLIVASQFD
ncbi:MAG: hypothetical protein AAGA30_19580, partial [Planctomycetota bacterium]